MEEDKEARRKREKFVVCEIYCLDKLLIQNICDLKLALDDEMYRHSSNKESNRIRPICANFYLCMSFIVTIFKIAI